MLTWTVRESNCKSHAPPHEARWRAGWALPNRGLWPPQSWLCPPRFRKPHMAAIQSVNDGGNPCLFYLAISFGIYLVLIPLVVAARFWVAANPQFVPFDTPSSVAPPTRQAPPHKATVFLTMIAAEIDHLGFEPLGWFMCPRFARNMSMYIGVFENRATQTSAFAYIVHVQPSGTETWNYVVAFGTKQGDGQTFTTMNPRVLPGLPTPSWATVWRFPGLVDLHQLHELHQLLLQHNGVVHREHEHEWDLALRLCDDVRRELEYAVKRGVLRLTRDKQRYRMGIRGLPFVFGMLWPITAIRRQRMYRQARQLRMLVGYPADYAIGDYRKIMAPKAQALS